MFRLGLTGSIGMGKSTTAKMFEAEGCAVWDADAAVHRIYSKGGIAVGPISAVFPQAVIDNEVSRTALKDLIGKDPSVLKKLEQIVHPLLAEDREDFVANAQSDILVFDIPLLFETGGDKTMDATVCVSVSPEIQEKRVLERGTMTPEQFQTILKKQMPDAEKRALSDYVVTTDTVEHARQQVQDIVATIREQMRHA